MYILKIKQCVDRLDLMNFIIKTFFLYEVAKTRYRALIGRHSGIGRFHNDFISQKHNIFCELQLLIV